MIRPAVLTLAVASLSTGVAAQERPRPPWSALTSPTAAMKVVFDDVCLTAVTRAQPVGPLALAHYLRPVDARRTGSPSATAAWRLGSWSNVYAMELPGGICSASVEGGDPDGLNAAALEILKTHGDFSPSAPQQINDAERIAWCTPEARRPLVAVLLRKTGGRRDAFVANVYRSPGDRPDFCPTA